MHRVSAFLDWVPDHLGAALFAGLAAVALAGLGVAAYAAISEGVWWALLLVLVFPALWLAMSDS